MDATVDSWPSGAGKYEVSQPIRVLDFKNAAIDFKNNVNKLKPIERRRRAKKPSKSSIGAQDLRLEDEMLEVNFPVNQDNSSKTSVVRALDQALVELRQKRAHEREDAARVLYTLRNNGGEQGGSFSNHQTKKSAGPALNFRLDGISSDLKDRKVVSEDEVVLRLSVHLSQSPSYVSEEWLVLGSTPLCALRDAIYCLMDENVRSVDTYYNNMREQQGSDRRNIYDQGAYFYIEGTFFEDRRHDPEEDLSRPILEYLKTQSKYIDRIVGSERGAVDSSFNCVSMEDSCFSDLTIRLGPSAPGLFCHQRCCEHLIVFKDVRLHNSLSDPKFLDQYPFKICSPGVSLEHRRQCEVCETSSANKVTFEDVRTPHSPFYWCEQCFDKMHYSSEGNLVYSDFKVFPYKHGYQSTLLHLGKI
jgi:snRNA-activating protein complex subunit 3